MVQHGADLGREGADDAAEHAGAGANGGHGRVLELIQGIDRGVQKGSGRLFPRGAVRVSFVWVETGAVQPEQYAAVTAPGVGSVLWCRPGAGSTGRDGDRHLLEEGGRGHPLRAGSRRRFPHRQGSPARPRSPRSVTAAVSNSVKSSVLPGINLTRRATTDGDAGKTLMDFLTTRLVMGF
jgi:hypothetical protein